MKETRQTILQKVFKVFLVKGYHGTSITDIQKELDIGRATLYHHFANKEELFLATIDEVFTRMGSEAQSSVSAEMTIGELIQHLKTKLYHEAAWLKSHQLALVDFFLLSAEALRVNPDYETISAKMHEKAIDIWAQAIINSINKGEVKKNIDVRSTARLFVYVKHGIGILSGRNDLEHSIHETQNGYETIYQLIKT